MRWEDANVIMACLLMGGTVAAFIMGLAADIAKKRKK
jgi:hypothetical protein